MIRRLWNRFWGPAGAVSLGLLVIASFAGGIIFWGGFNTAMEHANTQEFCISCHEMNDTPFQEYKASVHYMNASGVGASCPDCHVPKPWIPKIIAKVRASKDLYHHFLGTLDTPEKYEAHRAEMAKRVWAEMEATDSLVCRNCHDEAHMDFAKQKPESAKQMKVGFERGDTCIDCHKGIAHKLPDLSQGYRKLFEEIEAIAAASPPKGDAVYPITTLALYRAAADAKAEKDNIGQVLAGTPLKVLDRDGDMLKVQVTGWQQDQVEQVVYALRGQRIFEATIEKSAVDLIQTVSTETDADTALVWHAITLEGWVAPGKLLGNSDLLWSYTAEMYSAACGTCHSKPEPDHYLANQWIGTLKSMKRFITLDKDEYRILQKYLQLNAKDTAKEAHHG